MPSEAEKFASTLRLPFKIKSDAVIVLEGLDATGKSTQHERMERACMGMGTGPTPLFDPAPVFAHMPSAGTALGEQIYDLTESVGKDLDPLARQYLHLASHAQSVRTLLRPALKAEEPRPVVLDRWWWSTVAYGYFGGSLAERGFDLDQFISLCRLTWKGVRADLIALFMHPHQDDHHNTPLVEAGYEYLVERFPQKVVMIQPGTIGDQGEQLFEAMSRRGLYANGAS